MKKKTEKKIKEKPKGKLCPVLSKMFYVDVFRNSTSLSYTSPSVESKFEISTVTWHCERDKCQWWIPDIA